MGPIGRAEGVAVAVAVEVAAAAAAAVAADETPLLGAVAGTAAAC